MLVRIRLASGRKLHRKDRKNQHVALALAALMTPATVMAYVLAGWRISADFKATGEFPITEGFFSHWQVWAVAAAILHLGAILLNRYGKPEVAVRKTVTEPEEKMANSRF
jgi:hypothetical protein